MYLLERTKRDFGVFLKEFDASAQVLPDVPVEMLSPWKGYALEILQEKDDLRLIAGIRRSQVNQIESVFGVATLTDFAELSDRDVEEVVRKHSLHSTYRTLHRQASMQLQTRKNGGKCTAYELVEGASSLLLPPDSDADMFFDMEGFPLMKGGGLEYLFGLDVGMDGDFKFWWAHNRQEEEQAFVWVVRCICDLVEKEQAAGRPKPHVYHYGHYEVTALRRVALRAKTAAGHAARNTLDKLFEDGMFIDVFNIISSSIVVGEPSYSIKKIEKLVNISREDDELADAESSVGMYYEWRRKHFHEDDSGQQEIVDDITSPILEEILVYNRQDCRSLRDVVSWLRAVLPHVDKLTFVDAQDDPPSESDSLAASDGDANVIEQGACGPTMKHKLADSIAIRRCLELSSSLVALGSTELDAETRGIVAHLLMYHTRESLPSRKQFSNMIKQASESDYRDLFDDDQCISGISWKGRKADMETNKQYFEYTFPRAQLFKLTSGNSAAFVVPKVGPKNISGDESKSDISCFVSLKEVSYSKENSPGSLILSAGRNPDYEPPKFGVLVSSEDLKVCNAPLRQSILRTTEKLTKQKADASVALPLAFIERRPIDEEPSRDISLEKMRNRQTRSENVAEFLASRKLSCVFVIQGPPGSGKTSLSGEIIQQLVMTYGKTVAVSSNSHAAIDNLLSSAVRSGCEAQTVWKVGTRCTKPNVARFKANVRDVKIVSWLAESEESDQCTSPSSTDHASSKRTKAKATGALVGATCYQLSQECIDGAFDFLFVDEASQVPIPNFLSMSTAAKYAILVGDQQQLEMPIRGTHPEILEQSCLAYTVGEGVKTVPASRGIFLDVSYRMNPALCRFVSQHFYDHTLAHASICTENKLNLGSNNSPDCFQYGSHGISFISTHEIPCVAEVLAPTPSYGKWYQPIEVFVISQIVSQILGLSCTVNGTSKTIGASDILVVAPYNAQVRALKDALPQGIRVGTVDKFQGQEAPVTVLSTCTSESSEDWDRYKYNGDHGTDKNGWQNGVAMSFSSDSMPGNKERRGFCFALQKNRLNVAISRAQCLAVVVGDAHAFSRIPLITLGDVDVASLYESIVSVQSK
ncbi:unnamed protein product [Chondrus crispus]|uniref:Uncharacterized protein n=1 Tax=Chondrus crispus TaxID=2769 RepID=R7Q7W8_CHOCR|nr:unnamed protein product [Chondrus crispus]CDF34642.1 unnamed protein product [Chondrus crispus]|eukprot:XP_005714461.1 unnamed protein product [Chondrus crispus]